MIVLQQMLFIVLAEQSAANFYKKDIVSGELFTNFHLYSLVLVEL